MDDKLLSLGLKKAAIVLHALAFKLEDMTARNETLALVTVVSEAAYRLETLDPAGKEAK